MTEQAVVQQSEGSLLRLHVVPGARKTEVVGLYDGRVKLRIAAPAQEGKANKAIVAFLAKVLGLSRQAIRVKAGATGRRKSIEIDGIDATEVAQKLKLERFS